MGGADHSSTPSGEGGALATVDRFVAKLEDLFNFLAALFIFMLMFFLVGEVLGRKLLNAPIPGAIDWVEVWMASFAFMGAAYCQRMGSHVRMEMFVAKMKGKVLYWIECFAVTVGFIYVSIIAYKSFMHFLRAWEFGDSTIDIQLQVWPSKLIVPVALTLLAIRLLVHMWGYARMAMNPDGDPVAIPEIKDAATQAREEIEDAMGHDAFTDDNDAANGGDTNR